MPGRFRGLTDPQWEFIGPLIPDPFIGYVGRPHAPFRAVVNTIVWILITGARWADVPEEEGFASRSTAHRWLGIWSEDGTLDTIKAYLLGYSFRPLLISAGVFCFFYREFNGEFR